MIGPSPVIVRRDFEPPGIAEQRAAAALDTRPRRVQFEDTRHGTFLVVHFDNGMQLHVPTRSVLWLSDPVN